MLRTGGACYIIMVFTAGAIAVQQF